MSVEKIIAMAVENNALKLKEAFEAEVNARIAAALEEKYKKMAKESEDEMDDEEEDEDEEEEGEEGEEDEEDEDEDEKKNESFVDEEELENLDELKKSTLASYVSKAASRVADHSFERGRSHGVRDAGLDDEEDEDGSEDAKRAHKIAKHTAGIKRATTQLAKPDVQPKDKRTSDLARIVNNSKKNRPKDSKEADKVRKAEDELRRRKYTNKK